jgi:hypothetical protein
MDYVAQIENRCGIECLPNFPEYRTDIRADVIVNREHEDQREAKTLLAVFSFGKFPNEQSDRDPEEGVKYPRHVSST